MINLNDEEKQLLIAAIELIRYEDFICSVEEDTDNDEVVRAEEARDTCWETIHAIRQVVNVQNLIEKLK